MGKEEEREALIKYGMFPFEASNIFHEGAGAHAYLWTIFLLASLTCGGVLLLMQPSHLVI